MKVLRVLTVTAAGGMTDGEYETQVERFRRKDATGSTQLLLVSQCIT